MFTSKFKSFPYTTLEEMDISREKLAELIGITGTFDYALPNTWLKPFCEKNELPRIQVTYSTFMVYDRSLPFYGIPVSAWETCQQAINREFKEFYMDKYADILAQEINQKLYRFFGKPFETKVDKLSKGLIDLFLEL